MAELPSGIVTFLFTDIAGSTRLWENNPEKMRPALELHDDILDRAIRGNNGYVFKTVGDAFLAAFQVPSDAVNAAIRSQQILQQTVWGEAPIRVRMSIHTGQVDLRSGDYYGVALSRAARMLSAANPGQILISANSVDYAGQSLTEIATLKDLGLHRLKDLQRSDRIFQLEHPTLPKDFPPLRSLESFAHNLPVQLTTFIGRVTEIAELSALLGGTATNYDSSPASNISASQKTRLVTLTGTAGSGKTRLAQYAAADLIDSFSDGIWLVELAPIHDPDAIISRLAKILGVEETSARPLIEVLIEHLRHRELLIILDNCEHLIGACAEFAENLLTQCPKVQVLATSREILGIPSERVHRLDSLSIPAAEDTDNLDRLNQYESIQFFVDRAASARNEFTLNSKNSASVVQICRQLDGIPLALELAAARTRALSVEQIADRLKDRFRLLTGGSRTALPRHQTLGAALDWSFELLTPSEKRLFARLSVFLGGWTLDAAESICSDHRREEDHIDSKDVPDLLFNLVDKSLVVVEEKRGNQRFHLLETLREYALQHLQETDDVEGLISQHFEWFRQLSATAEPHFTTIHSSEWFDRLEIDIDNIYSALAWSYESGRIDLGIKLAGLLWRFWYIRSRNTEGRTWFKRLLQNIDRGSWTASTATAFYGAAQLARIQNDHEAARIYLDACFEIRSKLNDSLATAEALNGLGLIACDQGNLTLARERYEQSLNIYEKYNEMPKVAALLSNLGGVAILQQDYSAAKPLLERSLEIYRGEGGYWSIASALHNLGVVCYHQKDYAAALIHYKEALSLAWESGDRTGIATSLTSLGMIAAYADEHVQAVRLFGAAESLRKTYDAPLPDYERPDYDRDVDLLKSYMSADLFTKTWNEGYQLTPEETIQCALDI